MVDNSLADHYICSWIVRQFSDLQIEAINQIVRYWGCNGDFQ